MPLTISNTTGDGLTSIYLDVDIELPDSGSSIMIGGSATAVGGSNVQITGSPLTAPSPPGSGSLYFIIQVSSTTGAATIKQSTSLMPTPDAGNILAFSQTLIAASTDLALTAATTPDSV